MPWRWWARGGQTVHHHGQQFFTMWGRFFNKRDPRRKEALPQASVTVHKMIKDEIVTF